MFLITTLIVIVIALGITLFVSVAPQFGSKPNGVHLIKIIASPQYNEGSFVNAIPTKLDMGFQTMFKSLKEFATAKNTRPDKPLATSFNASYAPLADSIAQITWFGHSALLLELNGKKILLDPMLGPSASPVSFFGKRFDYSNEIKLSAFTQIDAVLISHDHYDHLDYSSIQALKNKVNHFYVPLGVGSHLLHWGIDASKITELDWWQTVLHEGIEFTATPARHFSGRGITDRNQTLWASWVIKGSSCNIYFSGDSGYGPHFKEIGERFGPFDFAMIECGQYNEKWEAIHMMPEQSMQAFLDVKGGILMPIHWGAFNLAVHTWTDGIERLQQANQQYKVPLVTPRIGISYSINKKDTTGQWWSDK